MISRPTKFLLDRGALIFATLTSTNYCVSPLVQGGLEIPCRVEVLLTPTVKNKAIVDIYKDMMDVSYREREKNFTIGSFLSTSEQTVTIKTRKKRATAPSEIEKEDRKTVNTADILPLVKTSYKKGSLNKNEHVDFNIEVLIDSD